MFNRVQIRALTGPLYIHRVVPKPNLCCQSCVAWIGSLSCWNVNLRPRLRSWALWNRFSLRISLSFAPFSFPSNMTSLPVLASEQPHSMRLLAAHFIWGWCSAGSSGQIILFLRVWGSIRCCFVNSKCVFMCLHWGEIWVWPHHHKAQIGEC